MEGLLLSLWCKVRPSKYSSTSSYVCVCECLCVTSSSASASSYIRLNCNVCTSKAAVRFASDGFPLTLKRKEGKGR